MHSERLQQQVLGTSHSQTPTVKPESNTNHEQSPSENAQNTQSLPCRIPLRKPSHVEQSQAANDIQNTDPSQPLDLTSTKLPNQPKKSSSATAPSGDKNIQIAGTHQSAHSQCHDVTGEAPESAVSLETTPIVCINAHGVSEENWTLLDGEAKLVDASTVAETVTKSHKICPTLFQPQERPSSDSHAELHTSQGPADKRNVVVATALAATERGAKQDEKRSDQEDQRFDIGQDAPSEEPVQQEQLSESQTNSGHSSVHEVSHSSKSGSTIIDASNTFPQPRLPTLPARPKSISETSLADGTRSKQSHSVPDLRPADCQRGYTPRLTYGTAPVFATASRARNREAPPAAKAEYREFKDLAKLWTPNRTNPEAPVLHTKSRRSVTIPAPTAPEKKSEKDKDIASLWKRNPTEPKGPRLSLMDRTSAIQINKAPTTREAAKDIALLWKKKETRPEAPRLHHPRKEAPVVKCENKKAAPFRARPMPSYPEASVQAVRPRRQSVPRVQPQTRPSVSKPFSPTTPKPFELQSLTRHEQARSIEHQRLEKEEEEERQKKSFKARPLSNTMLERPTFVPRRSSTPRTVAKDVVTASRERAGMRALFDAHTNNRLASEEQRRREEAKAKQQAEDERREKEWRENGFKARGVPSTTYRTPPGPRSQRKDERKVLRETETPESETDSARNQRESVGADNAVDIVKRGNASSDDSSTTSGQYSPTEILANMKRVLRM